MSVYRDGERWRFRKVVQLDDGRRVRLSGTPDVNTRRAAEDAERRAIEGAIRRDVIATYAPESAIARAITVPTLRAWFNGRYWTEHVIGEKENRAGTQHEKRATFERHIDPVLGDLPLDEIDLGAVNRLRAELAAKLGRRGKPLSVKTRANVLVVLSSALNYAADVGVIRGAPRIRVKAAPAPDVERWTFDQYGRIVGAAELEGDAWLAAVLLAGDAGLRIGEILALTWRDVDLVGETLRVARQERRGVEGPTKGGRPRDVPITPRLASVLRRMPRFRPAGRVLVLEGGARVTESIARVRLHRICRRAELPERLWHCARHTFASHAALLGVRPYELQAWLGHSTQALTMRYVSWASAHRWPVPPEVLAAGADELQPDRRVVVQLGARPAIAPRAADGERRRGNAVPTPRQALKIVG